MIRGIALGGQSQHSRPAEVDKRWCCCAHQLRTPLSAITFAAELLVTKGNVPVARRRFLKSMLTGVERMRRLSDPLLKARRSRSLPG